MNKGLIIIGGLIFCLGFSEVQKILFPQPTNFPTPVYDFKTNPLSTAKIELGRELFYDPILSKDNTISCATCHSPYNAFAHTDHDLSHGIFDSIGNRNAPALFNLAWQTSFMWDGAVNHLDVQALAPISHPKEMAESLFNVVNKLQQKDDYKTLFKEAYNDTVITGERVLKALSQFQLTLVSSDSKYDNVKAKTDKFNDQEEKGYLLFKANCNTCHAEPLFSTYEFASNGLSIDTTLFDFGKGAITNRREDSLRFKIPSLRNLSYSFPYMHDGRFNKLSEVLNHYDKGVVRHPVLGKGNLTPIKLSSNEKTDLIAFLLTLNDSTFVFNSNHQYPRK